MQKILPITSIIIIRVHWIFKIRRGRMRRRRRRRKWLLRMVLKLTPKRATTILKTTTVRKKKVVALKRPPPFTLKIPVNIFCENSKVYGKLIMKCPNCFWHDYYKSDLSDMRSPDPRGEKLHQRGLSSVSRL